MAKRAKVRNELMQFRKQMKLDQEKFGRRISLSRTNYNRIERGRCPASPRIAYSLMLAFDLPFEAAAGLIGLRTVKKTRRKHAGTGEEIAGAA